MLMSEFAAIKSVQEEMLEIQNHIHVTLEEQSRFPHGSIHVLCESDG